MFMEQIAGLARSRDVLIENAVRQRAQLRTGRSRELEPYYERDVKLCRVFTALGNWKQLARRVDIEENAAATTGLVKTTKIIVKYTPLHRFDKL